MTLVVVLLDISTIALKTTIVATIVASIEPIILASSVTYSMTSKSLCWRRSNIVQQVLNLLIAGTGWSWKASMSLGVHIVDEWLGRRRGRDE